MAREQLTSFSVNQSVKNLEAFVIKKTGLPKAVLHRKAVEYLYHSENRQVHPRLLITKRSDPEYVIRDAREQVYVSDIMRQQLHEIAELPCNNCSDGVVFFHALMVYCNIQYELLGDKNERF